MREFTLSTAIDAKPGLRDRLVTTALALLAENGSDALSLRAVARAAGVSAMAPYRHFPDKEALLAAVATRGFEAFREALQAADDTAEPGDALVAQAVAYVGFALANPALFRLMFGPPRAGIHDGLQAAGRAAFQILATRVAAGPRPEMQESLTLGCWALVHGLALLFLDRQPIGATPTPPAEITRNVAKAMLALQPAGEN